MIYLITRSILIDVLQIKCSTINTNTKICQFLRKHLSVITVTYIDCWSVCFTFHNCIKFTCFSLSKFTRNLLKLTWKVIYHLKRQPNFFKRTFFFYRVLAWSMSWLISFAWTYSTCSEREPRITITKFIVVFEPGT